ncbi:hypothetical protein MTR_0016s0040 [Medicago truncatula]|uniref:SHSP domain-containing protein n=1 Tax=Medicago truncatula TaxID=3880 RepID=A0A072TV60_MEDTR|nr:hypothetical protein MTR_0016s0040 [Medicago truncatula]
MACPKTRTLTAMVLYQVIRIESFKAANVGERQDYMLIRMYMPGRIKEDVYQNTLSIKAKMKCSVLKVVLPKMKDGETTEGRNNNDVIIVKVE